MKRYLLTLFLASTLLPFLNAQDTTIIQTLTYDSSGRNYVFEFPPDDGTSYEKILMLYNMRCKGALVSTGTQPNLGCGEWDYSCNTYIVDSTYIDSLKSSHPSHIIPGFSGAEFSYTNSPTYTYTLYDQQEVTYGNTINEQIAVVGTGTEALNHPFSTSGQSARVQYLWTADELTTNGLSAGEITNIRMDISTAMAASNFLKIKIKHTAQSELNASQPELYGFSEVYFLNTDLNSGENEFRFYNPFNWDGTSNVLVEFSFSNTQTANDNMNEGTSLANDMALLSTGVNHNLEFTGSEYIQLANDGFENISNEITIAFWSYGNSAQLPQATTIFEGTDNQNRRQANVHLPWSNSQVYWDCGNNGNYDRINKFATPEEFRGRWNHWAFTKNAVSGEMKIYLNGNLWHSGANRHNPIDLTQFTLGSSINQGRFYYGNIDEFQIWSVELGDADIQDWMHRSIDNSHPQYSNLISYYKMDEGTGLSLQNSSSYGGTANIPSQANWKTSKGEDLINNFETSTERPNISFIQGEYETTIQTVAVTDTSVNNQHSITTYEVNGTDLEVQSVDYVWQAGYEYLYQSDGTLLDSFPVAADGMISINSLEYYRKFPSQFEIMSFVTPYGINLDLGPNGKTWTFDMTDFSPILKGKKRMFMALGGQFQEEMDIKFMFIEGTPPRDVRSVQQIWRSGSGYGYQSIQNDDVLEPRDIQLDPDGAFFKIRTMVTGHGQEGEFIAQTHAINLDGGTPEFTWQAWTECANNPVYPQGGTWIYDRAGWCPGAPTDLQEWDITDMVTAGGTVNVDYTVNSGLGDSRYITSHQLVTYGPANFNLDASITEIRRPTNAVEFDRNNPACNDPIVVLRNTGATTLTSALITYGVAGGSTKTYEWEGSLQFMESEEVELPVTGSGFWYGGGNEGVFEVSVSSPNGGQDEYIQNNMAQSYYQLPDILDDQTFIINLNTNNFADQNSYKLRDVNGNILLWEGGFFNNTFNKDTIVLEPGCYELELDDTGDNGLEFWAQPAQGSGLFYVKTLGGFYKSFEPDFGKRIRYSFIIGDITSAESNDFQPFINIFPNPSQGAFNLMLDLGSPQDVTVFVSDMNGRNIRTLAYNDFQEGTIELDLEHQPNGMYHCTIVTKQGTLTRKIMKMKN